MAHLLAFDAPIRLAPRPSAARTHSAEMAFLHHHQPRLYDYVMQITHIYATTLAEELRPPPDRGRLARLATIGRPRPVAARVKRKRPRP